MQNIASSQLLSLVNFTKSFHLYSRYEMAKTLKSSLKYGDGFGDSKILKMAKEDFLKEEKEYRGSDMSEAPKFDGEILIDERKTPFGGLYVFEDKSSEKSNPSALQVGITASHKKLPDFVGKDYLLDISPESLFIIFPDLTFSIAIKFLIDIPWEEVRVELQETGLLEKDIAHLSGEAVSLDELRKKLKDTTSTDGMLIDLRKKFYSIAYAINESFENQIKHYEK
jgi:hypothetical protein